MPDGATTHFDAAFVVLYAFWFFFIALVFYIRREDKREGYPAESRRMKKTEMMEGFPSMPAPKTFKLRDGKEVVKPGPEKAQYKLNAEPIAGFEGAPLAPKGNPMLAGVGPGAYALRAETPDLDENDQPRIVPMRLVKDFSIAEGDPDPRGWPVIGCDGQQGGVCKELWVDRMEPQVRYLEIDAGGKKALAPIALCNVRGKKGVVEIDSITGAQFKDAPKLKSNEQITFAEEDRVSAYMGGGSLYATPDRAEPFL